MPSRPILDGRERRVYALVASLPYSGALTAFFSFEMTIEAFLEGHVRAFEWLGGGPRGGVYGDLRSGVAGRGGEQVGWKPCFLHTPAASFAGASIDTLQTLPENQRTTLKQGGCGTPRYSPGCASRNSPATTGLGKRAYQSAGARLLVTIIERRAIAR